MLMSNALQGLGDTNSTCDPAGGMIAAMNCVIQGVDTSSYTSCSSQADNDPSYTAVDAQLQAISSWNPTGWYNASDIQQVVAQQQSLVNQALSVLQQVGNACGVAPGCESGSLVAQMQANLTANPNDGTNVMTRAQNYLAAASQAQSGASSILSSGYVNAPGFKQWVQDSLLAVESAIHASLVIECMMPGWSSMLGSVVSGFNSFVNFVASIVGVAANVVQGAVSAGKVVVNAVETTGGIIGWILNNIPLVLGIIVVGAGGFYGYRYYRRRKMRAAPVMVRRRRAA
jgi:hypothetical protein